ncbi:MAG TPA: YraN family protein [Methylomirabilota bacterium]|nr:YraN family protein [Methylomirabilota bacterium]
MTAGAGRDWRAKRRRAYRLGLKAETKVAWMLRLRGFLIVAARYKTPVGEIDLVARRGRLVVFVEVKARTAVGAEADVVTPAARRRIVSAADRFFARHPRLADHERRFDIALVAPWRLPRFLVDAFGAET